MRILASGEDTNAGARTWRQIRTQSVTPQTCMDLGMPLWGLETQFKDVHSPGWSTRISVCGASRAA
jgi:hypothetical protein